MFLSFFGDRGIYNLSVQKNKTKMQYFILSVSENISTKNTNVKKNCKRKIKADQNSVYICINKNKSFLKRL